MDSLETGSRKRGRPPLGSVRRGAGKHDGDKVRRIQVRSKPNKKRSPSPTLQEPTTATAPTAYSFGFIDNEWQDGGIRGRVLICGKPGSGKSYLLDKRIRGCRRVILFNTANVDSFDGLPFTRASRPAELKRMMLESFPDKPLRVIYAPMTGKKLEHFDAVCKILVAFGQTEGSKANVVFAVDEIDVFMSANDPGPESFYELTNYGRHLRVAMVGTTRNTVAVSRQYTSMLTEIDIFSMTEPRYLKYFEDVCGAAVSDRVPLLGKHEYIRWMADGGTCERRKGWTDDRRRP
jgi:hypothetical protein